MWKNSFDSIDQKSDENERILIIEAKIIEDNFIVINIYNSNTESEELKLFQPCKMCWMILRVSGGDSNLIIDCKVKTNGGNPVLKEKYVAKLIEINKSLNLCDIWRI